MPRVKIECRCRCYRNTPAAGSGESLSHCNGAGLNIYGIIVIERPLTITHAGSHGLAKGPLVIQYRQITTAIVKVCIALGINGSVIVENRSVAPSEITRTRPDDVRLAVEGPGIKGLSTANDVKPGAAGNVDYGPRVAANRPPRPVKAAIDREVSTAPQCAA